MATVKLYVGNLPWSVTSDQLQDLFGQIGAVVSANVITDKYTGRSRGFGFVEMENEETANKAIEALNNKDFEGRNIIVNVAKPQEERPKRDFQDRGFRRSDRRDNQNGRF